MASDCRQLSLKEIHRGSAIWRLARSMQRNICRAIAGFEVRVVDCLGSGLSMRVQGSRGSLGVDSSLGVKAVGFG